MNHPHGRAGLQNNWQVTNSDNSTGIAAKPKEKLLKFIYIDITRLGGRGRQTVNIYIHSYTGTLAPLVVHLSICKLRVSMLLFLLLLAWGLPISCSTKDLRHKLVRHKSLFGLARSLSSLALGLSFFLILLLSGEPRCDSNSLWASGKTVSGASGAVLCAGCCFAGRSLVYTAHECGSGSDTVTDLILITVAFASLQILNCRRVANSTEVAAAAAVQCRIGTQFDCHRLSGY